ncbi:calexcitin-1 isoform X1 [Tribolium castaneum]|uniref:calexcitin-1 isoform X1 n=2 Tax=Tribolium castaneum TaxID=7070 RepID=UPI00046C1342|nr:PREDICTED: calexcitin-1 isoform X1 [Tribolium castaneum]|eukprot:XP_008201337.1 PREDICTED: calexcitin-1 isoform X1 [Tribolium castaneum]
MDTFNYGKTILREMMSRVMPRVFGAPLQNMPISDFRKKKLLYVFNVFFDVNQSGTIDRKDFELAIEKICSLRGWSSGTEHYKKTYDSMIQIWDGLRQRADSNKDGQVSVEEWASMWNEYAKSPENALEWQTQYLKFMFDLEDASGDGSIDVDEFTSVCSCYGLEPSECKEAFQKMSCGKKEVNYEQFEALWKQFFTSENPSDPGNFIFGKTKF